MRRETRDLLVETEETIDLVLYAMEEAGAPKGWLNKLHGCRTNLSYAIKSEPIRSEKSDPI